MLKKLVSSSVALLLSSQLLASNTSAIMECSRDLRPQDGLLIKYQLIRDDHNTYSLLLTKQHSEYPNGPSKPSREVLLSRLGCSASRGIALSCIYVGISPFDGPEMKLDLIKNAEGDSYSIETEITGHPMYKPPFTKKTVLESSIECTFPNPI